jgi:hypothetical protein
VRFRRCPATVNEKKGVSMYALILTSQIACLCFDPVPSEERELIAMRISSLSCFAARPCLGLRGFEAVG